MGPKYILYFSFYKWGIGTFCFFLLEGLETNELNIRLILDQCVHLFKGGVVEIMMGGWDVVAWCMCQKGVPHVTTGLAFFDHVDSFDTMYL